MRLIRNLLSSYALTTFLIGILLGSVLNITPSIEVDPKINISDFLSMAVTTAVGVYLAITIAANQSSSRFEKEFLITEANKVSSFLASQTIFSDLRNINLVDATSSLKELNILIKNLENMIPLARYSNGINMTEIRSSFRLLRHSLTSLPSTGGIINTNMIQRQSIIKNNNNLKKQLFRLIVNINSHR